MPTHEMNTTLVDERTRPRNAAGRLRVASTAVLGLFFLLSACKSIEPHGPPSCRLVDHPKVLGAEDITIDQETGIALISVDPRVRRFNQDPKKRAHGAIYAYDLTMPRPRLKNLTHDLDIAFHPHGIGLYTAEDGAKKLFVVNHRSKQDDVIEIFDYHDGALVHTDSIRDASGAMHSPNDIIPVGPKRFYVTNSQGAKGIDFYVEAILNLPLSYVLYYDGSAFHKAIEKVRYANGINVSHDRQTLYLAPSRADKIFVYKRNADGAPTQIQAIRVDTNPDNLEVDEQGNLWIGAHPRSLAFALYGYGLKRQSPSQVIKIPFDGKKFGIPEEIYLSEGRPLSASSVAAVYKDRLLIGSVFEGFLDCTLH